MVVAARGGSGGGQTYGVLLGAFGDYELYGGGSGVGFSSGKMQGFEVIVPGKANMEHTIIPSTEAKSRKDGGTRSIAPTHYGTTQVQNDGKHSTDEKLIPVEKPNISEIKDPALRQDVASITVLQKLPEMNNDGVKIITNGANAKLTGTSMYATPSQQTTGTDATLSLIVGAAKSVTRHTSTGNTNAK
ncbi:hypothetical protein Tco_0784010 [Tanacetum coccineum]